MKPLFDSLEQSNRLCKKTTKNYRTASVINVSVMPSVSSNILFIITHRKNERRPSLLESERYRCHSSLRSTRHDQWYSDGSEFDLLDVRICQSLLQFPRSAVNSRIYSFDDQKMYNREMINGVDMYTLTAYFVNPGRLEKRHVPINASFLATICSVGRTLSRLENEGTGTGLFLQNGSNPVQDTLVIPMWETEVAKSKWTRGSCFKTMGKL